MPFKGYQNRNKRFNVTLPFGLGEALERWAASEGNKPTTLASFLVETAVRQAIEQGRVPPPALPVSQADDATGVEPKTIQTLVFRLLADPKWSESPNPIETFADAALMEPDRIFAILGGERPSDDDVVALSRMVDWPLEKLAALVRHQYGNGKHHTKAKR